MVYGVALAAHAVVDIDPMERPALGRLGAQLWFMDSDSRIGDQMRLPRDTGSDAIYSGFATQRKNIDDAHLIRKCAEGFQWEAAFGLKKLRQFFLATTPQWAVIQRMPGS